MIKKGLLPETKYNFITAIDTPYLYQQIPNVQLIKNESAQQIICSSKLLGVPLQNGPVNGVSIIKLSQPGNYKTKGDPLTVNIGSENLAGFAFSQNAPNILFTLTGASNLGLWGIEGDLDMKEDSPLFQSKNICTMNCGLTNCLFVNPNAYVKGFANVIGSKNNVVSCNIEVQKVAEKRVLTEMDKICSNLFSKEKCMTMSILADTSGKILGIDNRVGRTEKAFLFDSQLKAPQIVEMKKFGKQYLLVYGLQFMDRKARLFDINNTKEALETIPIDSVRTEVLFPIYDEDTGISLSTSIKMNKLFSHVIGDDGKIKQLTPVQLPDEIKAIGTFPKAIVDARKVEILKAAVLTKDNSIKVLSIYVPKKNKEVFYDDIFVPTEVYPKKVLYEFDEYMSGKELEEKTRETFSLKPPELPNSSEIVISDAPNPETIKMKERMQKEAADKAKAKAQEAKLHEWVEGKKKKKKGKFDESDSEEEEEETKK